MTAETNNPRMHNATARLRQRSMFRCSIILRGLQYKVSEGSPECGKSAAEHLKQHYSTNKFRRSIDDTHREYCTCIDDMYETTAVRRRLRGQNIGPDLTMSSVHTRTHTLIRS